MLRWLAAIAALGGCALAGANASARLRRRRDTLSECVRAVKRIAIGITHTNRPIAQLLYGCDEGETGALFAALASAVEASASPSEAWEHLRIGDVQTLGCLARRDREVLGSFFSALGASERGAQLENTGMTAAALEGLLLEAETEYASKGRVYRTMGLLMGAGVGILLL